jgi:hypothetical protein
MLSKLRDGAVIAQNGSDISKRLVSHLLSLRNLLLNPPIGVGLTIALLFWLIGLFGHTTNKSICADCVFPQHTSEMQTRANVNDTSTTPVAAEGSPRSYPTGRHEEQALETQPWVLLALVPTFTSMAATILGMAFFKLNLDATRAAADAISKAAQANLEATKAAQTSVDVVSAGAERQLRAYVCANRAELRNFDVGKTLQAHVVMKNVGQTPAYKLISWVGVRIGEFPPKNLPPEPTLNNPTSRIVLAPAETLNLSVFTHHPLTQAEAGLMREGKVAVQVIGGVRYKDAFQKTRTTTFNLFYGGSYGMNTNLILNNGPVGNDAD